MPFGGFVVRLLTSILTGRASGTFQTPFTPKLTHAIHANQTQRAKGTSLRESASFNTINLIINHFKFVLTKKIRAICVSPESTLKKSV